MDLTFSTGCTRNEDEKENESERIGENVESANGSLRELAKEKGIRKSTRSRGHAKQRQSIPAVSPSCSLRVVLGDPGVVQHVAQRQALVGVLAQ